MFMQPIPLQPSSNKLILGDFKPAGGFPNPCEDHLGKSISLDSLLIKRPSSTFLFTLQGDSMSPILTDGSIIVVDRSAKVATGRIVLATIAGEFIVKEIELKKDKALFKSANPLYPTIEIEIDKDNDWENNVVWGVVTGSVKVF